MTREPSVATLRRLAEAVDAYGKEIRVFETSGVAPLETCYRRLSSALAAYRSEIAPLRTRAEVDAELVAWIRESVNTKRHINDTWETVLRLCREETSSGPSSADGEEAPSPRPPASPAGADLSTVLTEIRNLVAWPAPISSDLRERIRGLCDSYGPPGAVAAKESRDNAAAPEGAAKAESHACNPGERECNCDQALHLERRIGDAVRAIRRSNTIPAGLLHELLGILEGEA